MTGERIASVQHKPPDGMDVTVRETCEGGLSTMLDVVTHQNR
jgi:hypothetical protein